MQYMKDIEPQCEMIIVARKPMSNSIIDNIAMYGVGGLNIDECRVGTDVISIHNAPKGTFADGDYERGSDTSSYRDSIGRFPANLFLTYDKETEQQVIGGFPMTTSTGGSGESSRKNTFANTYNGGWGHDIEATHLGGLGDSGSASRYFKNFEFGQKDIFIDSGEINMDENFKVINGDMLEELDKLKVNSIDSIVTDPPYELNFMGKGWDNAGVSFNKETWEKCFRVLKPGGHLLAFGGSRTFHRIAVAIEDAGFEIRDTIMWIYGSGFPKSMNIGIEMDKRNGVESPVVAVGKSGNGETHTRTMQNKLLSGDYSFGGEYEVREAQNKWKGWGTQLKPSYEPVIVARKPLDGSLLDNVEKYDVGGINIDECRIEHNEEVKTTNRQARQDGTVFDNNNSGFDSSKLNMASANPDGRFPNNVILTYDDTDKEEVIRTGQEGGFPYTSGGNRVNTTAVRQSDKNSGYGFDVNTRSEYADSGSASRYFYCAKASKKDREEGLEYFEEKPRFQQGNYSQSPVCSVCGKTFNGTNDHSSCGENTMTYMSKEDNQVRKNIHPTVKPTELMQYLVRLVTPKGGTVLDPFMGSGTTGKAVAYENNERNAHYKFIGVELSPEYTEIAKARITYANGDMVVMKQDEKTGEVTAVVEKKLKQTKLF